MWIARFDKMITIVFTCFQWHENCLGDSARFTKYQEEIDYIGVRCFWQREFIYLEVHVLNFMFGI